jgi:hypothetical protein
MTTVFNATIAALAWLAAGVATDVPVSPAAAGSTRPLYVFAPSADDPRLARQRAIVAGAAAGFRDRDMPVIVVAGGSVAGSSRTAAALRARFGVAASAFRVVLVGKDGGVKLSAGTPVTADTLYRLVDSMPMRRREMRERGR